MTVPRAHRLLNVDVESPGRQIAVLDSGWHIDDKVRPFVGFAPLEWQIGRYCGRDSWQGERFLRKWAEVGGRGLERSRPVLGRYS